MTRAGRRFAAIAAVFLFALPSQASDLSYSGHVTFLDPSALTSWVAFKMDASNVDNTCTTGTLLVYSPPTGYSSQPQPAPTADTMKGIYATLLAGIVSQRVVRVTYDSVAYNVSSCPAPSCCYIKAVALF